MSWSGGSCLGACTNPFCSPINVIANLVEFKELLWCDFCLKLLFFPPGFDLHQSPVHPWAPWDNLCYLLLL